MTVTRRSLLLRLRDHADEDAWTEFHASYAPLVRQVARRSLNREDCEDLLQEVMLGLAGSMPEFEYDPSKGRFRGLLQTITQRAIAKKVRQKSAAPGKTSLEACAEPSIEDRDWEEAWRQHHLERAMTRLESECSERDRLAFRRYAIEGE
ncbi:MAG: sigma-70 family RNA polymerase sigma factor, partial [Planctomycetota bacterium]